MLLTDWVFAQQPRSVAKVVAFVLEERNLRLLIAGRTGRDVFNLPERSGRNELVAHCFNILRRRLPVDYARPILEIAKENCGSEDFATRMEAAVTSSTGTSRTRWLELAGIADTLSRASTEQITNMFSDDFESPTRLDILMQSGRFDVCELVARRFVTTSRLILDRGQTRLIERRSQFLLARLAAAHDVRRYTRAFEVPVSVPLRDTGHEGPAWYADEGKLAPIPEFPEAQAAAEFVRIAEELTKEKASDWNGSLNLWSAVVEKSRAAWGESWAAMCLANVSAGVKDKTELADGLDNIFDSARPLCERARYARLKSGSIRWWRRQFEAATSELEFRFAALLLLTWGGSKVIVSLAPELEFGLARMRSSDFADFITSTREGIVHSRKGAPSRWLLEFDLDALPARMSPRLSAMLCRRARYESAFAIYSRFLSAYDGNEATIWTLCHEVVLEAAGRDEKKWPDALRVAKASYQNGIVTPAGPFRRNERRRMPLKVAEQICAEPAAYPIYLVRAADSVCTRSVGARATPVAKTAEANGWFDG
jgi:hypothetical protein